MPGYQELTSMHTRSRVYPTRATYMSGASRIDPTCATQGHQTLAGAVGFALSWSGSAMTAQKYVLGLIHAGREIRRPPLVGMQFLHEGAVRAADLLRARPRLHAKDLIGLLLGHFAAAP